MLFLNPRTAFGVKIACRAQEQQAYQQLLGSQSFVEVLDLRFQSASTARCRFQDGPAKSAVWDRDFLPLCGW